MTLPSLEPIAFSAADATAVVASPALSVLPAANQFGLPAEPQLDSSVVSQFDLSEKPLASCLAENERLTRVLDQALFDVRQLVASSVLIGRDAPVTPIVIETPVTAETPFTAETSVAVETPVIAETPVAVEQPIVDTQSVVAESPVVAEVSDDGRARSPSAPSADAIVAAGIVPAPEVAVAAQRTVEASAVAAPAASAVSQGTASAMPSQALVETASAVADALIVTPGLVRGEGVVTVQLKSEVLDGAQVTIAVNGRQMEVAFVSGSAETAALIARNLPQIQQYLGARIHSFMIGVKLKRTRS